jgi:transposase
MLALALVMEGVSRGYAAHACGMDRQTLRDWVHRYNADGLSRLADRWGDSGPKRRLSPTLEAGVAEQVRLGPDHARHGVVRWWRIDLAGVIEAEYSVVLAEWTVGVLLPRLGFSRSRFLRAIPDRPPGAQQTHKRLRRPGCCRGSRGQARQAA